MKEAEGSKARARGSLVARGDSYDVAMLWDQDEVRLTLAQSGGVERWSGCFDAQYIEEVTKKTGNSKKFAVFLQMLQAAIEQQDNSVYLDVLTCSDLRALKHRKNALSDDTASAESAQTLRSPKRYLILTYAAQFDRVHYPLPLSVEETAGSSRSQDANACALPSWQQRSSGERLALMSDPTSQPVQRLHQLQQEKEEIQAAYERLLADTSRKLAKMRRKCDGLTADLQAQTDRASALQVELVASRSSDRSLAHVQAKLQRLEQERREERNDLQHAYDKHKRELVLLNAELNRSKREAERSRRHARQLEAELKILQRRAAATRVARGFKEKLSRLLGGKCIHDCVTQCLKNQLARPLRREWICQRLSRRLAFVVASFFCSQLQRTKRAPFAELICRAQSLSFTVKSERARHTNKGIESIDIEANSRSAKINAATDSQKENLDVVDRVRCARFESGVAPALDVTQDIRDIDRRLSALQSYLKTAKGSQ
ncbi:hypothetical protein AB1Y20_004314 [Prymnesium parvum]|uniref:Coiled-coil domain-containing protein 61 n=1 Tax=Prymnesium parvum TaxID=97485 RepID=A0AB34IYW5_PRYPA